MSPTLQIVLFGCIGGALSDILRLIKNRDQLKQAVPKLVTFLTGFLLQITVGGVAAVLAHSLNLLPGTGEIATGTLACAAAYGFSGPEAIARLLATPLVDAQVAVGSTWSLCLRQWWAL